MQTMYDCPFKPCGCQCELEIELMVQSEALEEASEAFHRMEALALEKTQRVALLERILRNYGIQISESDD